MRSELLSHAVKWCVCCTIETEMGKLKAFCGYLESRNMHLERKREKAAGETVKESTVGCFNITRPLMHISAQCLAWPSVC